LKSIFQTYVFPVKHSILVLLAAILMLPQGVSAECKEFKIVEYEDRVEAVCVGEPLTEAQKKANLEDEKRQELESQRQRNEEQRRQREAAAASKAQTDAEAAAERKRQAAQQSAPKKPAEKNLINLPKF
jgi:hypothetical protein